MKNSKKTCPGCGLKLAAHLLGSDELVCGNRRCGQFLKKGTTIKITKAEYNRAVARALALYDLARENFLEAHEYDPMDYLTPRQQDVLIKAKDIINTYESS